MGVTGFAAGTRIMSLPISYNLRNLRHRPGTTAMTALGIALTVMITLFILELLTGLNQAFVNTGDPLNVLVMRKGSDAELSSIITHQDFATMKILPEVARDAQGRAMASGELMVVIVLPRRDGTGEVNVSVRGMSEMGQELRPDVRLVAGRWFRPGQREIVVSQSIRHRFANVGLGDKVRFGKGNWTVVGVFDAGNSAHSSEIWADVDTMAADFGRPVYSSALLHTTSPAAARQLIQTVSDDQRLELSGQLEPDYYAAQTKSGGPIKAIGTLVAIIMAIGSCFAAMNTMYAAVAYRSREIATLRILGFSRPSILLSFMIESMLLSLLGGLAGVLLALPLSGMSTGTSNAVTFSEVVFHLQMTPGLVITALLFALLMGLIGGLAPAWHASRQEILVALRS